MSDAGMVSNTEEIVFMSVIRGGLTRIRRATAGERERGLQQKCLHKVKRGIGAASVLARELFRVGCIGWLGVWPRRNVALRSLKERIEVSNNIGETDAHKELFVGEVVTLQGQRI